MVVAQDFCPFYVFRRLDDSCVERLLLIAFDSKKHSAGAKDSVTRIGQIRQFGVPTASSLGPIAFDRLALSLGPHGVRVSTPGEIAHDLRKAIDRPAVTLIRVPIIP